MNKLTLTPHFLEKLDRLTVKVNPLSSIGADLSSYENLPIIAVVGTRKPTPYGRLMTEKLTEELAREGVVIISGLALGIDGIAHSATMRVGGRTIAVVASGLNNIGPVTNQQIADKIISSGGTILSEYPADYQPRKVEFLQRNRIIAALSDLVLIPEAAALSGSLNTANHALAMNIPVCVVPGNVTSPMSSGTNHLLKNGAHAVTEAADVLKLLGIDKKSNQMQLNLVGDTAEETILLQKLSLGFNDSVSLQVEAVLSTVDFQSAMTMLEVQGRIAQNELGNWYLT
jgi:DNA processing protein